MNAQNGSIHPSEVLTVEERLSALEAQQVAMGVVVLKTVGIAGSHAATAKDHLGVCTTQLHILQCAVWMLAMLNVILLCALCAVEFAR